MEESVSQDYKTEDHQRRPGGDNEEANSESEEDDDDDDGEEDSKEDEEFPKVQDIADQIGMLENQNTSTGAAAANNASLSQSPAQQLDTSSLILNRIKLWPPQSKNGPDTSSNNDIS